MDSSTCTQSIVNGTPFQFPFTDVAMSSRHYPRTVRIRQQFLLCAAIRIPSGKRRRAGERLEALAAEEERLEALAAEEERLEALAVNDGGSHRGNATV